MNDLIKYLDSRFKNKSDYVLYHNKLICKTGVTMKTISGINEIQPIQAITTSAYRETPHELIIYFIDEDIQLQESEDRRGT